MKKILVILLSCLMLVGCSDTSMYESEISESEPILQVESTATSDVSEKIEANDETISTTTHKAIIETGMTDLYKNIFLNLSEKIDKITFDELVQIAKDSELSGYTYEIISNSDDDFSTINIYDENGDYIFIFTFPNDVGNETLTTLSYNHTKKYSISISDNCHYSGIEYSIHDETRESYNSKESSWSECEIYMFGTASKNTAISELAVDDKTEIERKVYAYVTEYMDTTVNSITINDNYGSEADGDYIVLVYLTWDVKNSGKTSKEMLDLYSSDMAAQMYDDLPAVLELCIFWTVPYLNDGQAKISFERKSSGMVYTDTVFDSNFD